MSLVTPSHCNSIWKIRRLIGRNDPALGGQSPNELDLSISGSGGYHGDDMRSKRANVHISGSGRAVLAASEELNAGVSGSGSIEYVGWVRIVGTWVHPEGAAP